MFGELPQLLSDGWFFAVQTCGEIGNGRGLGRGCDLCQQAPGGEADSGVAQRVGAVEGGSHAKRSESVARVVEIHEGSKGRQTDREERAPTGDDAKAGDESVALQVVERERHGLARESGPLRDRALRVRERQLRSASRDAAENIENAAARRREIALRGDVEDAGEVLPLAASGRGVGGLGIRHMKR